MLRKGRNKAHSIILSPSDMLACSPFASRFPAVQPCKSIATGCMAPEHHYGLAGLWPCDPFVPLDTLRLSPQSHSFSFALKEQEEIGTGRSLRQKWSVTVFPTSSFEASASVHSVTVTQSELVW